ncbi:MBL fold metallo-hydrolase [Pedobacter sp. P351]|uniref:MBL fold metallo-hydrolase n=1 Tax=Pedobacter superstes TaxID=3133441 RepID=UPI0030B336F3
MISTILILLLLVVFTYIFLHQPQFGKISSGKRLERIRNSPNYRNGKFQNINPTPDLTEGVSYFKVLREVIFNKSKSSRPPAILPSSKTDLLNLNLEDDILVWFGHSSYFIQVDGKKILVDPIFSGRSSPVKFTTRSYTGSDVYSAEDMPEIDYLFLSHDHWDHLDYETVIKLNPKIKKVITGLGVGAHLEHWGYSPDKIIECDWNEEVNLEDGFKAYTAPGRHFSGRGLKRNQVLWMSFVLATPCMKIYLGGDSGYDSHFAKIGSLHGPVDLAILECGQYDKNWKYIHMMPEEIVQAAIDLKAKVLLPVHWAKFSLAQHAWDEPITRVLEECEKRDMPVLHPMIGESIYLKDMKTCTPWWLNVR